MCRNFSDKQQSSTNERILATSQDLKKLLTLVKPDDKREKLIVTNIANDFKSIVQQYQDCQKILCAKLKKFSKKNASQQDDLKNDLPDGPCTSQENVCQLKVYGRSLEIENQMLEDRAQMFEEIERDVRDLHDMLSSIVLSYV